MDVYIFGAGASAAEGAPATRDFLARAWSLLGSGPDRRVANVWQFLTDIFGVEVSSPRDFAFLPAIDQIFSMVDWSLHADQGLGPAYDPPRLNQVRRDLEHLMCATLGAALETREQAEEGPYARFVRRLLDHGGHRRFALFSLNYDTLLDSALAAAGAHPDYGFGSLDLEPHGAGLWQEGRPLLAKLHGSLNWAICKACDHVEVTLGRVAHLDGVSCSRCGSRRLHALIVSPTVLKSTQPPQLRHVWDLALECLQRANRLVFVGYSLPTADIAIYQLICRGLLTRPAGGRPRVEVVTRSDRSREHFLRLFGPDVSFDCSGFSGQV